VNPTAHRSGGIGQALLLLAPVLVLAFPAFLAADVVPQATGVGLVAFGLLPAALAALPASTGTRAVNKR
jgi:hypothetical protein